MTEAQPAAAPAVPHRTVRQRYPWLLPGGLLLLLALLTINVLTDGPLVPVDRRIHKFVHATGNSAGWRWLKDGPATPARLLVDAGSAWVAIPVLLAVAAVVAYRRQTLRPVLTAATGAALLPAIVLPSKLLIEHLNPGYRHFSRHVPLGEFPSGHATTAVVCYVLAVLVIAPYPAGRGRRIALRAAGVLGFLAGAAMVWCNMHRCTDVVAGWTLAALIILLTLRLTRQQASQGESRAEQPAGQRALAAPADPGPG
jgi:membrane-associated phospholipid phosphatase